MKLQVNTEDVNANNTSKVGYLRTTYAELKKALGQPVVSDGKVRVRWEIQGMIDDNTIIATIYDWKENYPLNKVPEWHIGG